MSLLCESPSSEGGGNTLIDGQTFLASLVIWRKIRTCWEFSDPSFNKNLVEFLVKAFSKMTCTQHEKYENSTTCFCLFFLCKNCSTVGPSISKNKLRGFSLSHLFLDGFEFSSQLVTQSGYHTLKSQWSYRQDKFFKNLPFSLQGQPPFFS